MGRHLPLLVRADLLRVCCVLGPVSRLKQWELSYSPFRLRGEAGLW